MAIELAAAIAAAQVARSLVVECAGLVKSLDSRLFSRNVPAKDELDRRLTELNHSLRQAARLAWVADAYSRINEEVLTLLQLCERAEYFLRENIASLTSRKNEHYASDWRSLQLLFDAIRSNRDVPRLALLDRAQWYSKDDTAKIDLRLNDFSAAYERASLAIQTQAAREAQQELRMMIERLSDVQSIVADTIYNRVLRALQRLGDGEGEAEGE